MEALHELPDVHLALLTGNLEPTGYLKLKSIELDHYFPFGAFGSDHPDRYKLPRIAIERAFHSTGTAFAGKNVVIIGDTRHDILCGRDLDVFTIAVSTGHYSAEDLSLHNPDILLENLDDVERFVQLLAG
jgi:phosphoglycolate phosphatase-like HAD superfamily hydrolase